MKKIGLVCLFILVFGVNSATADLLPVVKDGFNSYTNGSVIGQGGWKNRATGDNFVVQGTTVLEGAKALYITGVSDSVIVKKGTNLTNGMQTFYVKTENRDNWVPFSRVDFRMLQSGWDSGIYCDVALQWNGKVEYVGSDGFYNAFATIGGHKILDIDLFEILV